MKRENTILRKWNEKQNNVIKNKQVKNNKKQINKTERAKNKIHLLKLGKGFYAHHSNINQHECLKNHRETTTKISPWQMHNWCLEEK